jgi:hypothetical protein
VQIASSKLYAYVQMRSLEEAGYILQTFNKIIPYIDNCAGIVNDNINSSKINFNSYNYIFTPIIESNFDHGKCKCFEKSKWNK